MSIELVTTTGSRPVAFALCEKWMARQTVSYDSWLVVDDSVPETSFTLEHHRIPGPKLWRPNLNTQRLNLDAAISSISCDKIFIIEDDDYYAPTYLEIYSKLLDHYDVIGEANSKYYHLPHAAWKPMRNFEHAALCTTAFRKKHLDVFEEAVNSGEKYIDIVFWKLVRKKKIPYILLTDANLCIGIKGLPGRPGIGIGHDPDNHSFVSDDTIFTQLRRWVGDGFEHYLPYLPKKK